MWFFYILPDYAKWHYGSGIKAFWKNFSNFLSFFANFFSISLLFKTLFSPWRRMNEPYAKGFDPENFFSTLIVNGIMRVFGFFIRALVIIFGLLVIVLFSTVSLVFFGLWIIAPLLILFFISLSLLKFVGL